MIRRTEYGVFVCAVMEGVEAHLVRTGVEDGVVASAIESLYSHTRRLYVAEWLRQAFDIEEEVDEDEEARAAEAAFDSRVGGHVNGSGQLADA